MKKIFILAIAITSCITVLAQKGAHTHARPVTSVPEHTLNNGRTSALGDTTRLSNISSTITNYVVYTAGADSGYLTGTDAYQDMGFAERYTGGASTVQVIGVFAQFAGKVSASSAKTVSFSVWGVGAQQYITSSLYYSGFPTTAYTTQTVPYTQLGIGATADTLKRFMFDSASPYLSGNFFVGYTTNYNFGALAGDTIGLASSPDGARTSAKTMLNVVITDIDTVVDTVINVQNATQWSDGQWHDNYTDNDSISNDLAIFPIVILGGPSAVKGITKKDLTFYGSYPNPANSTANIKFALATSADVTIQVMDMGGKLENTITQDGLATGEHIITVNTASLPAGDHLYLIRTSTGAGMAGKMTVIR